MSRPPSYLLPPRPRLWSALLACALAVALAAPAHAGIGDFVKKAAKQTAAGAAGKKAEQSVTPGDESSGGAGKVPEFNNTVLELTDARIGKILAGLKVGRAANVERAALADQQRKIRDQEGQISDKYGHEIDVARDKHEEVDRCWGNTIDKLKDKRNESMQQKMMADPALRQKWMDMAQGMARAQASGDTAAVRKAQIQMESLVGATHEDTLAAQQKCGPLPPLHPMGVKLEGLQKQSSDLDDQMREVDEKSLGDQARASGLNAAQFAMARERIEMYLARPKGKPYGVTADEAAAIEAHRAELEAALKPS